MDTLAASLVHAELSGRVLAALLPVAVVLVGFEIYCLVDLLRAPRALRLPKPIWAVLIVAASPPFGAIAYLVLGRDHYGRQDQPADDEPVDIDEWSSV